MADFSRSAGGKLRLVIPDQQCLNVKETEWWTSDTDRKVLLEMHSIVLSIFEDGNGYAVLLGKTLL